MQFENTLAFAQSLDEKDELKHFRQRFYLPRHGDSDCIYFTGNSLGLQPRSVKQYIDQELDDWARFGVEGHFNAKHPWVSYHELFPASLSKIVGCLPHEVVVMNQLTVNLHLLMVSFYRPTKERYRIVCEAKAFPSDQYAFESQVKHHGFDPADAIIEIAPRPGEHQVREEDILSIIKEKADSIALVIFGGINYYTGQLFDMAAITEAAHAVGAYAGFDLAHAAGNVKLELHKWNVDFACWCSYKYLNSSPGGVSGIFINERHVKQKDFPRFAGWWGSDKTSRFLMNKNFDPIPTAEGWQLSNAPNTRQLPDKIIRQDDRLREQRENEKAEITPEKIPDQFVIPSHDAIHKEHQRQYQQHHFCDIFNRVFYHKIVGEIVGQCVHDHRHEQHADSSVIKLVKERVLPSCCQ
ncbi:kynureninase, partial [Ostertagia ostertagi]